MSPGVWSVLAKYSRHARFSRVLLLFAGILILLFIPLGYTLLKAQPYEMFSRLNNGTGIKPENFTITETEIVFTQGNSVLALEADIVPDWVFEEEDYNELFNYLALYNGYLRRVYLPIALTAFAGFTVTQGLFYFCAAWIFGQTRLITTYMTMRERFSLLIIASLPAVPVGLLAGFFLPVIHLLIFEAMVIYLAYKTLGEY